MDIRSFLKKRKYFLRIYVFISVTIIVLIAVFSSVSYSRIRTKFFDDEVNNGIKILIQMKNNIQSIDSIVRETCISFFYDYDIRALMFLRKEDAYLESHVQTQLMRSISVNDFIHSIYVYNNNRKIYFSTSDPFYHSDIPLEETLMSLPSVPVLKPILRNIETRGTDGQKMTQQVITYCYFEQTDSSGKMDGAIIVNIKIDWILNNIYEIGEVDNRKTDDFFLVNSYGDVINEKYIDEQFDIEMQDIMASFKTDETDTGYSYLAFYDWDLYFENTSCDASTGVLRYYKCRETLDG